MSEWSDTDRQWMQRALELADRGLYTTRENPRVGCVLVKDGRLLGEGFHRAPGQPHAEIEAMAGLSADALAGATCYVTLEPCSHYGKTPPCADALLSASVARVVVAMEDPNPQVSGQGVARLKAAGLSVEVGLMSDEAHALNPGFVKRMTEHRPWVFLKSAASLDGRTAMADGESKWITAPAARADVQRLRARVGAVITGIETVLADDPLLTVRADSGAFDETRALSDSQPLRVILDSKGRLPDTPALLGVAGEVLWVTTGPVAHPAVASGRMGHWQAPSDAAGRVALPALLSYLAELGVSEVLVEAGATLAGAFITEGLVDHGVLYLAGKLLGPAGRSLYDVAPAQLTDAPTILISTCQPVGEDLRIDWRLRND